MKVESLVLFHCRQHPEAVLPLPASLVPLLGSAGLLTLTVKPQACRHAHMHPGMQACMHLSFGTTVYNSQNAFLSSLSCLPVHGASLARTVLNYPALCIIPRPSVEA